MKQKAFIQIPLLIAIIVAVVLASGATTGVVLYKQGKLTSLIAGISQVFKGTEDIKEVSQQEQELEQARLEAEKVRQEAEVAKAEAERLKTEQEEAQRITELEQRIKELEGQAQPPTVNLATIIEQWKPIVAYVECEFRYSDTKQLYETKVGSGILWRHTPNDPIMIFTNKHIVTDEEGYIAHSCRARLPSRDYIYSSAGNWEGIYYFMYSGADGADITIDNPDDYVERLVLDTGYIICEREWPYEGWKEASVGDEVVILGYPLIGSQKDVTVTRGIVSGFEEDYYYITDAKIDQGNSGGAAILLKRNCLLGVPTYAMLGKVESLGRILDIWRWMGE